MANRIVNKILRQFFFVESLYWFKENYQKNCSGEPGSFGSPIVSVDELKVAENEIWPIKLPECINGIDLNTKHQLDLLKQFETYYPSQPFETKPTAAQRYYFDNEYYSYTDALILYSFIRHWNPRRIVEVGSGFSSALIMDTREHFHLEMLQCSFIDPKPERLYNLMSARDRELYKVYAQKVQEVDTSLFSDLEANDILFIDGSHVCKTGSDLNYTLFTILPLLKPGVLIHFHDIFYPFEYPKKWVYAGFNWNEVYLLRGFLSHNSDYSIEIFSHYLHSMYPEAFSNMPLCYKNGGGNIWLRKLK
jgi:predicted O-methyltransferase YrrM